MRIDLHIFEVTIGGWALLAILGTAALDSILRLVSLGSIESVAIDATVFSFVYSVVELIRSIQHFGAEPTSESAGDDLAVWAVRVIICSILALGLAAWHGALRKRLEDQVRRYVAGVGAEANLPRLYEFGEVAADSVDLTFRPERRDKLRSRDRLVEAFDALLASAIDSTDDRERYISGFRTSLVIERGDRVRAQWGFLAVAIVALAVPVFALSI